MATDSKNEEEGQYICNDCGRRFAGIHDIVDEVNGMTEIIREGIKDHAKRCTGKPPGDPAMAEQPDKKPKRGSRKPKNTPKDDDTEDEDEEGDAPVSRVLTKDELQAAAAAEAAAREQEQLNEWADQGIRKVIEEGNFCHALVGNADFVARALAYMEKKGWTYLFHYISPMMVWYLFFKKK